jgi:VanZ family protein
VLVAVLLLAPGDLHTPAPAWLEWFAAHGGDKAIHAGLFFVQAACLGRTLRAANDGRPGMERWAALGAAIYGVVLEVAQLGIGGRSFELGDVAADAVGAAAWPLAVVVARSARGQ